MRIFIVFIFFLFVVVSCVDSSGKQEEEINADKFSDVDSDNEFINEKELADKDASVDVDNNDASPNEDDLVDTGEDNPSDDDQEKEPKFDCVEIKIKSLEKIKEDGRQFFQGTISKVDGEDEDVIKFAFLNEDGSWNYQLQEKSYDLGSVTNSNSHECTECLWIISDIFDDESKKHYFQESGTFEVEEVGQNVEAYGTLNARFVEMELNENDKYVPIPEGDCLEVKDAKINTLCEKRCNGKVCGNDGCGGICGNGCGEDEYCDADQTACIEYDCKNVTIDWGIVLFGEGPGSDSEYEMRIYMEFNEFFSYSDYDDFLSIELWKKFAPGIYDIKATTSAPLKSGGYE